MDTTKVFSDLVNAYTDPAIRVVALKGGTRSSKTWSVLQLLNYIGNKSKSPRLISAVSETMPHLKRGAIRDFKNMLETDEIYDVDRWHDTDKVYTFGKAKMEFFSADQPGKVHGPARDVLYINEAINIGWETYRQLSVRTTEKVILDYNPTYEFWIDEKLAKRKDVKIITSTYLDNDMLSASQISEIESNREIDPEWWKVYGEGQTGSKIGLVIQNWDIVQDLPPRHLWKKAYIGIDFGWSSPTAIMLVVIAGGEAYIDQLAYKRQMDNRDMSDTIKAAGYGDLLTICDAAVPQNISELRAHGINAIKAASKDIQLGIQIMNRYKKHYTARSLGSIDENRKYHYTQGPDGNYTGTPIDAFNHAKDSERYVFLNKLSDVLSGVDVTVGRAKKR